MKVVIIGGVAGGATAAARIRRLDEKAQILVFEGFINIPVDELRDRLLELDKNKKVYIICQSGLRSYIAYRILTQEGYDCRNFSGGFRLYETVTGDKEAAGEALPCGMEIRR